MMVTKPKIQCKQCNTNKNQAQQNLDQVSMMTGTTLLEKDIDTLLYHLLNVMQAKNLISNSMASGSQITGATK